MEYIVELCCHDKHKKVLRNEQNKVVSTRHFLRTFYLAIPHTAEAVEVEPTQMDGMQKPKEKVLSKRSGRF